jgi:hypothetical protein
MGLFQIQDLVSLGFDGAISGVPALWHADPERFLLFPGDEVDPQLFRTTGP